MSACHVYGRVSLCTPVIIICNVQGCFYSWQKADTPTCGRHSRPWSRSRLHSHRSCRSRSRCTCSNNQQLTVNVVPWILCHTAADPSPPKLHCRLEHARSVTEHVHTVDFQKTLVTLTRRSLHGRHSRHRSRHRSRHSCCRSRRRRPGFRSHAHSRLRSHHARSRPCNAANTSQHKGYIRCDR